jgi:predicted GNAT superfamily acetyltransferase
MFDACEVLMTYAVRDLTQYDEFLQVREVQQQIWGFTQGEGLYPPMLKTAAENGGTIIGAFDGPKLIGFLFGFLGLHADRRIKLCSQTMGILPEYRNKGVAATLKWAQRERVLANDIDLITWTYDPLEAPNARLNLRTLGGVARVYRQNIYGENFGALSTGLPTDRFLVEWWLKSDRVQQRHDRTAVEPIGIDSPIANACAGVTGNRRITALDLNLDAPIVRVEIPNDLQAIKKTNMALAQDWRLKTRDLFEAYFARGYEAIDFVRAGEVWGPARATHNWYVLQHAE